VARFGEPCATPFAGVDKLFPTAQALACAEPADIGTLGIVRTRVGAIQALARAVAQGRIALSPSQPVAATLAALRELPGVGDWTAELVALRVLAWPDAFPASDVGVLRALGAATPAIALQQAEAWRPWRSYAVMQLWHSLTDGSAPVTQTLTEALA
jgi:AraC family transcriptional regulator, regulatory protein of adaptative response / DNA-3-methyladenine glycosylase II